MSILNPMPPYMEEGSKGQVVDLLLKFLDPEATKEKAGGRGIILDGFLGKVGMSVLHGWQRLWRISTDGGFGPEGRETAKERLGFDLEAEAEKLPRLMSAGASTKEITEFVQPDGSSLYWAPGIPAATNLHDAVSRLYKSRHGN